MLSFPGVMQANLQTPQGGTEEKNKLQTLLDQRGA